MDTYDCFIFYNELDLLEIRLNELSNVVDYHVLVEGTKTFQGSNKKLFYDENKSRFSDYEDKIIHVVVDDYPERVQDNPWEREFYTRNAILDGLESADDDDQVLIADVDEIPKRRTLAKIDPDDESLFLFALRPFYYYLNMCVTSDHRWIGPVLMRNKHLIKPQSSGILRNTRNKLPNCFIGYTPQNTRRNFPKTLEGGQYLSSSQMRYIMEFYQSLINLHRVKVLPDSGWHFTYQGGIESIIDKIETYSHAEYNEDQYKNRDQLQKQIEDGELVAASQDKFSTDVTMEYIGIEDHPVDYIREHRNRFEQSFYQGT